MNIESTEDYFSPEKIKQRQLEDPYGQIVWLLKGSEVGRDVLMNKSFVDERRKLAYINGINEYDNFLFIDKDGKIKTEGNSFILEGEQMGKLCGRQYAEFKKQRDEETKKAKEAN